MLKAVQHATKDGSTKHARIPCPIDDPNESPAARNVLTRPPTGTPRRASSPGEGPSYSLYLSLGEWPRKPFTARIERAQFHRARSAHKKGTWPLPALLADFFRILLRKIERNLNDVRLELRKQSFRL